MQYICPLESPVGQLDRTGQEENQPLASVLVPKAASPISPPARATILDQYVMSLPCPQNALDIFKGEWSSSLPDSSWNAGSCPLWDDDRIKWGVPVLGGIEGKTVLELGPLEGGHTYLLERMGAESIVAVEANTRSYLKCLITKELLELRRSRFLCGDFIEYLRCIPGRFDISLAVGVLYHMRNPVELLGLLAAKTDHILLWTHYYDSAILSANPILAPKFPGSITAEQDGFRHTLHRQEYQAALEWAGFCGGNEDYSHWLSRDDILGALQHYGFRDLQFGFEQPDHPNGPSFAIAAIRR